MIHLRISVSVIKLFEAICVLFSALGDVVMR